jgi:dienelactone hydrolase
MVVHELLRYTVDSVDMLSDFYAPEQGRDRPGVLVFPGGAGLGDHARSTALDLAEEGYAALACDLHGGGKRIDFRDLADSRPVVERLTSNPDALLACALTAMKALAERPEVDRRRIGAVGYCMGGLMALELARSGTEIAAVVGVHSPVSDPRQSLRGLDRAIGLDDPSSGVTADEDGHANHRITAKILILNGADDPTVPRSQYESFEREMRSGGVDWQLHLFGGTVHSFAFPDAGELGDPDIVRYDPRAAARAWKMTCDFLGEVLGRPGVVGTTV